MGEMLISSHMVICGCGNHGMGTTWALFLFQEQNSYQSGTDLVLEPSFFCAGKCCVILGLCSASVG